MNNVPTPLMQLKGQPWPEGSNDFVNHRVLSKYIKEAARLANLSTYTRFNTLVECAWKTESSWKVLSQTLSPREKSSTRRLEVRPCTSATTWLTIIEL